MEISEASSFRKIFGQRKSEQAIKNGTPQTPVVATEPEQTVLTTNQNETAKEFTDQSVLNNIIDHPDKEAIEPPVNPSYNPTTAPENVTQINPTTPSQENSQQPSGEIKPAA